MWIWALITVCSIAFYLFACGWMLPKVFLSTGNKRVKTNDYGVRRFVWRKSTGVEYLPHIAYRKYIKKYVIMDTEEGFTLTYEIANDINYIDFDIHIFSQSNKLVEIINIKDIFEGKDSHIKTIDLPQGVSYVSVIPKQVNNTVLSKEKITLDEKVSKLLFSFFLFAITVAEGILIEYCMSYLLGGVFKETVTESIIIYILPVFVGFIYVIVANIVFKMTSKKTKKLRNKNEH